jgi:hypothetical protein
MKPCNQSQQVKLDPRAGRQGEAVLQGFSGLALAAERANGGCQLEPGHELTRLPFNHQSVLLDCLLEKAVLTVEPGQLEPSLPA